MTSFYAMSLSRKSFYACFVVLLWLSSSGEKVGVWANDTCDTAIVVDSFPFDISGNNTDATVDFETPTDTFRNLTCGISPTSKGVWFKVGFSNPMETGNQFLRATVTPTSMVKFVVALFTGNCTSGDDHKGLECVTPRDYDLENARIQPTLTWFAEQDVNYYLHITGMDGDNVGTFDLSIDEIEMDRPENDQCATAMIISDTERLGDNEMTWSKFLVGDSTGSWPHEVTNPECSVHTHARGLFYRLPSKNVVGKWSVTLTIDLDIEHRVEMAYLLGDACSQCLTFSDFLTRDDTPHSLTIATDGTESSDVIILISGESFDDVGIFQLEFQLLERTIVAPRIPSQAIADRSGASTKHSISSRISLWANIGMMMVAMFPFLIFS